MSRNSASLTVAIPSQAFGRRERHQGLLEALACLSGCALAVAIWYGLNMIMTLSTLNLPAMIAD